MSPELYIIKFINHEGKFKYTHSRLYDLPGTVRSMVALDRCLIVSINLISKEENNE